MNLRRMGNWFFVVLGFYFIQVPISLAETKKFGLGAVIGEPMGISGKYWYDGGEARAINVTLGRSFQDIIGISAHYVYHFNDAFAGEGESAQLVPYLGGGIFISYSTTDIDIEKHKGFEDTSASVGYGFQIPMGLEWSPNGLATGWAFSIEFDLGFFALPERAPLFQGSIGTKYYFPVEVL